MFSYDVIDTWDPSLLNSITCILTVALLLKQITIQFGFISNQISYDISCYYIIFINY